VKRKEWDRFQEIPMGGIGVNAIDLNKRPEKKEVFEKILLHMSNMWGESDTVPGAMVSSTHDRLRTRFLHLCVPKDKKNALKCHCFCVSILEKN